MRSIYGIGARIRRLLPLLALMLLISSTTRLSMGAETTKTFRVGLAAFANPRSAPFHLAFEDRLRELSLQGQTSEEIQRQVSLLQTRQRLATDFANATDEAKQRFEQTSVALANTNFALTQASRETQRMDEAVRSVADTVDNSLVKAMQDAFDGKRVTDWGAQLKSITSQILSGILNFALIRPAIGQPLGLITWGEFGKMETTT